VDVSSFLAVKVRKGVGEDSNFIGDVYTLQLRIIIQKYGRSSAEGNRDLRSGTTWGDYRA